MTHRTARALLAGQITGPITGPLCLASVGECMVEIAPAMVPGLFQQSFAGDALNTLWYLRQLAPTWEARFVSRVGQDQASGDMVQMMDGAGIATQHIRHSPDRTVGLYMISVQAGERSFSYWRSHSAAKQLADDPATLIAAFDGAHVVFFSGITLAILAPAARTTLLHAMATARAAGKTVVFDPNHRPRLWPNMADMCVALTQGAAVSDIVLPSYDEEAAHFGDTDPAITRARYLAAGAKTVVVKNGPGSVFYAHHGQLGAVNPTPAPASAVIDSTSAGDSFNAGLLVGMARFDDIKQAIALACAVARQVIAKPGALVTLNLDAIDQP